MRLLDRYGIRPPKIMRWHYPHALWREKKTNGIKRVYLTFDDGPTQEMTHFILDELDRHEFKGTFFVVGENACRHPELIEEILKRGHSIGNHTMHHLQGLKTPWRKYISDIEEAAGNMNTRLFRPPHGFMRPSQYFYLRKRYRIVMFDLVTRDFDPSLDARQIAENVRRLTRNGSIIVFHDSIKTADKIKEVLPPTLQWLKDEGYECPAFPMD